MQRYVRFEQIVLRRSIWMTAFVGISSILFGLVIRSHAIAFDGILFFIDAAMTMIALQITRLVAHESTPRFQRGFWHMEPIVLFLNGGTLIVLCFYAFVESVSTILHGGDHIPFDYAAIYTFLLCIVCFSMAIYERRINHRIESDFIRIDSMNWLATALISSALLPAFVCAWLMRTTSFAPYAPFVDPLVLMCLSAATILMPLKTVRNAIREILLITPERLDTHVRSIMNAMQQKYGFMAYTSYAVKVGRACFIELHVILQSDFPIKSVKMLDAMREDIASAIGDTGSQRWLTISFTGDEQWS